MLGCGPIAQIAHFDAVRKARNAELYAICDLADDLRERMAMLHQPLKVYSDAATLLADPEVEAVLIGVADQFHVSLAMEAIRAGKHVLVEKPLGVTVEECEQLRAEVSRHGRILQVGNNRRFDPGIAFVPSDSWASRTRHRANRHSDDDDLGRCSRNRSRPPAAYRILQRRVWVGRR